ncbi:expressed protein [Echinococcus multilocularis]|uniref:Expressed protein n=1 Tax=Echinococcus multilocularis TaxID=6211 RepID=A0A087W1L3_ECHMU|nr:expressed protein [Echinococcus multilocularis]
MGKGVKEESRRVDYHLIIAFRDFPEGKRRHTTRAAHVHSAQRRYLGYWHGRRPAHPA